MVLQQGKTGSCKSPLIYDVAPSSSLPSGGCSGGLSLLYRHAGRCSHREGAHSACSGWEGGRGRGARGQGMGVDGRASQVPGVGRDREGAGKEGAGGVHHPAPPVSSTH